MNGLEIQFLLGLFFFIANFPVITTKPFKVVTPIQFVLGVILLVLVYFRFNLLGV